MVNQNFLLPEKTLTVSFIEEIKGEVLQKQENINDLLKNL